MKKLILALTMLPVLILAGCITSDEQIKPTPTPSSTKTPYTEQTPEILGENVSGLHNLARFKSEDEMREYLASKQIYYGYPTFGFAVQKGMPEPLPAGTPVPMPTPTPVPTATPTPTPTPTPAITPVVEAAKAVSSSELLFYAAVFLITISFVLLLIHIKRRD